MNDRGVEMHAKIIALSAILIALILICVRPFFMDYGTDGEFKVVMGYVMLVWFIYSVIACIYEWIGGSRRGSAEK